MAIDPLTDPIQARTFLERATAAATKPALTSDEVMDLVVVASSLNDVLETVYTGTDLNRAAALGWQWKAGKVAGDFTTALEGGMKFNREQVYAHCMDQAARYATGTLSVIGSTVSGRQRSGIGSISLVTESGV